MMNDWVQCFWRAWNKIYLSKKVQIKLSIFYFILFEKHLFISFVEQLNLNIRRHTSFMKAQCLVTTHSFNLSTDDMIHYLFYENKRTNHSLQNHTLFDDVDLTFVVFLGEIAISIT